MATSHKLLDMRTRRKTLPYVDEETAVYRAYKAAQKVKTEPTPQQRARRCWSGMNSRVKTEHYAERGIEVRWTYEEFEAWFCSDKNQDRIRHIIEAKETPSIDRVSPLGHYEESNCRIIPTKLNRALGEVNALVSRMKTLQAYLKKNEDWLL